MNEKYLTDIIQTTFDSSPDLELVILGKGAYSQAYSFVIDDQDYVLRTNNFDNSGETYKKDEFAFLNFKNLEEIPEIIKIGSLDNNGSFCVSKRMPGNILNIAYREENSSRDNDLVAFSSKLHSTNVSEYKGYGYWRNGVAKYGNWKDYILFIKENTTQDISDWNELFRTTFFEEKVYKKIVNRMEYLCPFIPKNKYLIHGDYKNENILSGGNKITGILDWECSKFGDFLFDYACLNFWIPDNKCSDLLEKYYTGNFDLNNYKERIEIYFWRIFLDQTAGLAIRGKQEEYTDLVSKYL